MYKVTGLPQTSHACYVNSFPAPQTTKADFNGGSPRGTRHSALRPAWDHSIIPDLSYSPLRSIIKQKSPQNTKIWTIFSKTQTHSTTCQKHEKSKLVDTSYISKARFFPRAQFLQSCCLKLLYTAVTAEPLFTTTFLCHTKLFTSELQNGFVL